MHVMPTMVAVSSAKRNVVRACTRLGFLIHPMRLAAGTRVTLRALVARPELNGRTGTVLGPEAADGYAGGRVPVLLDGGGRMLLKLQSLIVADGPPPTLGNLPAELLAHVLHAVDEATAARSAAASRAHSLSVAARLRCSTHASQAGWVCCCCYFRRRWPAISS